MGCAPCAAAVDSIEVRTCFSNQSRQLAKTWRTLNSTSLGFSVVLTVQSLSECLSSALHLPILPGTCLNAYLPACSLPLYMSLTCHLNYVTLHLVLGSRQMSTF